MQFSSLQYAETNVHADYLCFKSRITSMESTSKLLKEGIVSDILKESDESVISDSNDDGDDSDKCEDDIAVADAAVDEEDSQVEDEGQGHSLGNSDYNSGFIQKDMQNYHG
jgi:hypothetical protein